MAKEVITASNADAVIKEAAQLGFTLVEQHDFVKPRRLDYFLIFEAAIARRR